jgi:hypothetical protein
MARAAEEAGLFLDLKFARRDGRHLQGELRPVGHLADVVFG